MTDAEMTAAGFVSKPATITDERGRPTRPVFYRAVLREKMLARLKPSAANGIRAGTLNDRVKTGRIAASP